MFLIFKCEGFRQIFRSIWLMFLLKMTSFWLGIGQIACESTAWIVVLFKTSCAPQMGCLCTVFFQKTVLLACNQIFDLWFIAFVHVHTDSYTHLCRLICSLLLDNHVLSHASSSASTAIYSVPHFMYRLRVWCVNRWQKDRTPGMACSTWKPWTSPAPCCDASCWARSQVSGPNRRLSRDQGLIVPWQILGLSDLMSAGFSRKFTI